MKAPLEIRIPYLDRLEVSLPLQPALAILVWREVPGKSVYPPMSLRQALEWAKAELGFDTSIHYYDHATQEFVFRFL